ncbi:MAG TPA: hypothetical protein VFG83_15915 [Kofleriaceae bacterium]|nr:hypothetical protein [Kofleriaceae bacterium]
MADKPTELPEDRTGKRPRDLPPANADQPKSNLPGARSLKPHWTERLATFDRRWVFLAMAIAIVVPFFAPLNLPVKASPRVRALYYSVESLHEGDVVFLSMDFDPASTPELAPFFRAVALHLKRKGVKMVLASTWYAAPPLVERYIREMVDRPLIGPDDTDYKGPPDRAYKQNVDYVWLGFREGKEAVIAAMGNDLRATFDHRAADGTPLADIPMMEGIHQLKDFDLIITISAGFPGTKEYVQQVQSRYDLPIVAACTAVSTTDLTPYYDAGQLLGLVGGMGAVAEYESLIGKPGLGTQGADVLNFGHLVVILAIVFGNFIYFAGRRQRRKRGQ